MVPAQSAPEGATFYLCDFDGTVATEDVGNRFFRRFCSDLPAWDALIDQWRAGSMGGREVLRAECALLDADEGEARTFVSGFGVDPAFAGFVSAARARGGEVAIASDGLLWYLRPILDAHGLEHVDAYANDARFEDGRLLPRFGSPEGEGCGHCGTCKGAVLARIAPAGATTVFVGDGLSDKCGARAADRVYAKGDLLAFCREEGIAATPFMTFDDVARGESFDEDRP